MSINTRQFITQVEGCSLRLYRDVAGFATIGVGHKLTKDEIASGKIYLSDKTCIDYRSGAISKLEADKLLADDLRPIDEKLDSIVKVPLGDNQRTALLAFIFNVGLTAFTNSTLLRLLNAGDYPAVPKELERWVYAAGHRVTGLENRRKAEIQVWSTNDTIS